MGAEQSIKHGRAKSLQELAYLILSKDPENTNDGIWQKSHWVPLHLPAGNRWNLSYKKRMWFWIVYSGVKRIIVQITGTWGTHKSEKTMTGSECRYYFTLPRWFHPLSTALDLKHSRFRFSRKKKVENIDVTDKHMWQTLIHLWFTCDLQLVNFSIQVMRV